MHTLRFDGVVHVDLDDVVAGEVHGDVSEQVGVHFTPTFPATGLVTGIAL